MNFDDLYQIAERVAKQTARDWPGIDAEDIAQEIMVHVLENRASFEKAEYHEGAIVDVFKGVAKRYAGKERYSYTFHSAQYVYTPSEIRAVFEEAFFNSSVREKMPRREPGLVMDETNDLHALLDIDTAFDSLPSIDQTALRRRYQFELEYESDAERKRVNRAIDTITRALNNRVVTKDTEREGYDGPGSRRATTNAASHSATGTNY